MLKFRGGLKTGRFAALAVSAALAVGAGAVTTFASDHEKQVSQQPKLAATVPTATTTPKIATTPKATPVTQACQAAIDALKAAGAKDKPEDTAEKLHPQANAAQGAADKAEDLAEKTQAQPAGVAAKQACKGQEPQRSATCVAALNAYKALKTADKAQDKTERQTAVKTTDPTEKAKAVAARAAARQACGSQH